MLSHSMSLRRALSAAPISPSTEYARRVAAGALREDAAQVAALRVLDRVHSALDLGSASSSPTSVPPARASRGLFASLFGGGAAAAPASAVPGAYLWVLCRLLLVQHIEADSLRCRVVPRPSACGPYSQRAGPRAAARAVLD